MHRWHFLRLRAIASETKGGCGTRIGCPPSRVILSDCGNRRHRSLRDIPVQSEPSSRELTVLALLIELRSYVYLNIIVIKDTLEDT